MEDFELKKELQDSQIRLKAARKGLYEELSPSNLDKSSKIYDEESNVYNSTIPNSTSVMTKPISKYTFVKPSRIFLTPLKKSNTEFSICDNHLNVDLTKKNDNLIQLSYIDNKSIEPYISLKTIDELYNSMQERSTKKFPFIKNSNTKGESLSEFLGFVCNTWIKSKNVKPNYKKNLLNNKNKPGHLSSIRRNNSEKDKNSIIQLKRAKIQNFNDGLKLYEEEEKLKEAKKKLDISKWSNTGYMEILDEIYIPSIKETNTINNTREAFRCYYLEKERLHKDIVKKLNCTITERPFVLKFKRNRINSDLTNPKLKTVKDYGDRLSKLK